MTNTTTETMDLLPHAASLQVALIGRTSPFDSYDHVWGVVLGLRVYAQGLTKPQADAVLAVLQGAA